MKTILSAWRYLLFSLLIAVLTACERDGVQDAFRSVAFSPTVMLTLKDFFDQSYINNNIARGMAFFGQDEWQFLAYYDPLGQVIIVRRHLGDEKITRAVVYRNNTGQENNLFLLNPHHFISGGLDKTGRIHLVFGAHNDKPIHLVSHARLMIDHWQELRSWIDHSGQRITYPYLVRAPDGTLWLFYRDGQAGKGHTYYFNDLNANDAAISPRLLIDGTGENSQYLFSPLFTPDGCLHIAWTWRLSDLSVMENNPYRKKYFQGVTNRDIAYAKTCDRGLNWRDSSGQAYTLPIIRQGTFTQQPETIDRLAIGQSFFNHYGSDYDASSHPHYTYFHWDSRRHTQIWHLFHDGHRWIKNQVSDYPSDIRWNRHQVNGLAGMELARPEIVVNPTSAEAIIVTRSNLNGNILELYRALPPYANWQRILINSGSLGGWEPQIDKRLWHERGLLEVLINTVRDQQAYQLFDQHPNPQERIILEQVKSGEFVTYPDYSILAPVTSYPLRMENMRFNEYEAQIWRFVTTRLLK